MAKPSGARLGLGACIGGLFVAAALSSCEKVEGCEYTGSCPGGGAAGNAGAAGSATDPGAGDDAGGTGPGAAGADSGGNSAGSGGDGEPPVAMPCDGECSGATPVCDEASDTCVECTVDGECSAARPLCQRGAQVCIECTSSDDCAEETPLCDLSTNDCVECLTPGDCPDASAARCEDGACVACQRNADCAHVPGRGVCDGGVCVVCTPEDESACGVNSCNPVNRRCSTTPRETAGPCQPCLADSECIGGGGADPTVRCVPMEFKGTRRAGGYCLRRVAKTCTRPFVQMPDTLVSLSDAAPERYCGVDQQSTRCEAVLDLINGTGCLLDSNCGCTRDASSDCTGSGEGGLCRAVAGNLFRCTYPCARSAECPSGLTCTAGEPYCH